MPQEQVVYFLLALIGLAIVIAILTGYNIYADLVGNFTPKNPIITVLTAGGERTETQVGGEYEYMLSINANLQVNPEPKEDTNVIMLVGFKDENVAANEFILHAGEKRYQTQTTATITSRYPPLSDGIVGANTFSEGQEYVIRSGGGVFKVGMVSIRQNGFLSTYACKAKFSAECKDLIQYTADLESCAEDVNSRCTGTVYLCGGSVVVTLRKADCLKRTAEAEIDVEGGTIWEPSETATISFFRKSDCTNLIKDPGSWKSQCQDDFLGSHTLKI